MMNLDILFGQFADGRLRFEELRDALAKLARADHGQRPAVMAALTRALNKGHISADAHGQLSAYLSGSDASGEQTVVTRVPTVAPVASAADDVTRITVAPDKPPTDAASRAMKPPASTPVADDATVITLRPERPADATRAIRAPEPPDGEATRIDMTAPRPATADATRIISAPPPPTAAADQTVLDRADAENNDADATRLIPMRPVPQSRADQATLVSPVPASTQSQPGTWSPGAAGQAPVKPLTIGSVLKDRFVLESVLGAGGMGMVFKALDQRKSEARDKEPYVALKVMNPEVRENPDAFIMLQREVKRTQALSHPNIINVFDFDRDGPHFFMSMEYLAGRPLNHLIRDLGGKGMPFKKAWPLIKAMGEALGYAHKKDLIHSDFKPGNVFVSDANDIKVLDFGIACIAHRAEKPGGDQTLYDPRASGAMTPAYASLEMLEGKEPDPTDDIYALGCVAYELLAGKHPYGKLQADKALEVKLQPKPIPGLNRRQWRGLQRALALRREQRTRSIEAFLSELSGPSALFYGLWAMGLTAAIATSVSVYLGTKAPVEAPRQKIELTEEQKGKVHDLLELAGIHFEVGYLTAPTGSNALWAYQEALKIDPYSEDALKGLRKIADAVEQLAWEAFEKGDRAESLKKVVEGLEAVPDHKGLLALRAKLER